MIDDASRSWYLRKFHVPSDWSERHVLLNFGAVDYGATVFVNGARVGFILEGIHLSLST